MMLATAVVSSDPADSSTSVLRPSSGRATLIPGQALHLQCETKGLKDNADFKWFRRVINNNTEEQLVPEDDDEIRIHNERLTLVSPSIKDAGEYYCRPMNPNRNGALDPKESAVIKVRAAPYIADFGVQLSHTGRSGIVTDGERLELVCSVPPELGPITITWLRSMSPDDESAMVPLQESPVEPVLEHGASSVPATVVSPDGQSVLVEVIDSHSKRLLINSVRHEHRGFYVCVADNGVTERTRKVIYVRVKDRLAPLWPLLGIVAELFILLTIIQVWETQRAYRELHESPPAPAQSAKTRHSPITSGPSSRARNAPGAAAEAVPLTAGS